MPADPRVQPDMHFYRDVLGFEVRLGAGEGPMRWITLGAAGQPDTHVVLQPPECDPGVAYTEAQTIADMMATGTYAGINLASDDLDGLFQRLTQAGVEVMQVPKDQIYGLRDCAGGETRNDDARHQTQNKKKSRGIE